MKPYTNQEAFDKIVAHIFSQGERAVNLATSGCAYLVTNGTDKKCAVGCLLNKRECKFMDGHENGDIHSLWPEIMLDTTAISKAVTAKLSICSIDMLSDLQECHDICDNWDSTEDMRKSLHEVGVVYELDVSGLKSLHFGDR